jgi:uncharacterized protein (DUF1501 family)
VPAEIDEVATMGQLLRAIRATGRARTELADALGGRSAATGGTATGGAAATAGGTADGYGQEQPATAALALAAGLVLAEHAPRVVYVSGLGDFDTHQGQAARHRALLRDLDAAVDGFLATLEHAGAADRALLMTVSEFGRRPQENGSGTDHGTAAAHFVVGATVRGGRYGAPPTLAALDDHGNVKATTDYRSLYATALQSWLGVDAAAVLGKGFAPLPLLA